MHCCSKFVSFGVIVSWWSCLPFIVALMPISRWGHSSAISDNKLYIFGGKIVENNETHNTNSLLVINLESPFSTSDPPWEDVTDTTGPKLAFHSMVALSRSLCVFGGDIDGSSDIPDLLYSFDLDTQRWSHSTPTTPQPSRHFEQTAVSREGRVFIFGGMVRTNTTSLAGNEVLVLQPVDSSWSTAVVNGDVPTPRSHHTATLTQDGKMYVLGGYDGTHMVDMSVIYVFDTNTGSWTLMTSSGATPKPRRDHTAVATSDGKIIVFGGTDQKFAEYYNDIAVLDTTKLPMRWSFPTPQGNIPPGRYTHTCNIAGTRMLCAFGYMEGEKGDNSLYVLDTLTWAWSQQYVPDLLVNPNQPDLQSHPPASPPSSPLSSPSSSSSISSSSSQSSPLPSSILPSPSVGTIAGSVIGTLAGVAALGAVGYWARRRWKWRTAPSMTDIKAHQYNTMSSFHIYQPPIDPPRRTVSFVTPPPQTQAVPPQPPRLAAPVLAIPRRPVKRIALSPPAPPPSVAPPEPDTLENENTSIEDTLEMTIRDYDVGVQSFFVPRQRLYVTNPDEASSNDASSRNSSSSRR
ncbi:uncharacterized protein VTP21DRAFT_11667 [Calcarisporiella thermophila]|uniref:uncharacterized protein n=1 Tax=Calcarisporiella thermophila TaxID=911321 RepID=UPI003743E9F3